MCTCVCVQVYSTKMLVFDPPHLGQDELVLDDIFVGGQEHVELPAAQLRHEPAAQHGGSLTPEGGEGGKVNGKQISRKNNDTQNKILTL